MLTTLGPILHESRIIKVSFVTRITKSNNKFKHGNMLNTVNFPIEIMLKNFIFEKLNIFITIANNVDYCDNKCERIFSFGLIV